MDTRAWSQILVSILTDVPGLGRKKGADLADGSDVKAANTWESIDKVRFNGVLKAGTQAAVSGSMASLDKMPHLFFVLWDQPADREAHRCRVWAVRTRHDVHFREMSKKWFEKNKAGEVGDNFQLHPPLGKDSNRFANRCGNLLYPLLFCAEKVMGEKSYKLVKYDEDVLKNGACQPD